MHDFADERGSILRYLLDAARKMYDASDAEEAKGPDNPKVLVYMFAGQVLREAVADIERGKHRP